MMIWNAILAGFTDSGMDPRGRRRGEHSLYRDAGWRAPGGRRNTLLKNYLLSIKHSSPVGLKVGSKKLVAWIHSGYNGLRWEPSFTAVKSIQRNFSNHSCSIIQLSINDPYDQYVPKKIATLAVNC